MTRTRASGLGRAAWTALVVALALAAACNGAGEDRRAVQSHANARVGGAVISTVDGRPITVSEVQELVAASGLSPDEALRKLQAERLLMIEAERRGLGRTAPVDWVARQARVQALLEAVAATATVSDEQIRAAYDKAKARFDLPERRVVAHVLAHLPKQATAAADAAARGFAADMVGQLARAPDVQVLLASVRGKKTPHFEVVSESLPPLKRDAAIVPAFRDAVFALREPGVVAEPIKTPYGWHAIRLLEIQPASGVPYAQAAEQLGAELLLARKKELVDELLASARKQHRIELAGELRETLAKLEL